jgi:hypothetical protein
MEQLVALCKQRKRRYVDSVFNGKLPAVLPPNDIAVNPAWKPAPAVTPNPRLGVDTPSPFDLVQVKHTYGWEGKGGEMPRIGFL